MTDHKLLPKHGEMLVLDESDADRRIKEIVRLQQQASLDLSDMIGYGVTDGKKVGFPCKQCVLDIALQFHDLSEALKGLIDGK